jgi:hypothetical protein
MNLHPQILSPSEEPFALYFYKAYRSKTSWTDNELHNFIDEFWLIAEKSLELFFTSKEKLFNALQPHKAALPYSLLLTLIYLQFVEPKPKEEVRYIVDKQIKYFFYLPELLRVFPESKFIILTRDPRVNAQRKKLRNLNSGSDAIYLSALWKNTYSNIAYLKQQHKAVKIVRYEDMVSDPETTIRSVCEFLGVSFIPEMLHTDGVYESFLNHQENKLEKQHVAHLKDFHSGLFTSINTDKVGLLEDEIDETINNKIIKLTGPLLKELGYELNSTGEGKLNLSDRIQVLKAYLYRPWLIRFYLHIPLSIKLMIKKIRKKKAVAP